MIRLSRAVALVLALILAVGVRVPARAEYTPGLGETAGNRMLGLKLLNGKPLGDPLALNDEITRAELVTVMVRAFGMEEQAKLLAGASSFTDVQGHWAAGNIAMAKALVEKAGGDAVGMPDGSFNPNAKLTPAQAVAFLMKFLGVKADPTKAWPANYLDKAVALGLITAEDKAQIAPMANNNATRGLIFYLFDKAFYSYDLGNGKTLYTKYVDPSVPVLTVNEVATVTADANVVLSGKVTDATELQVGNRSVAWDANGNFAVAYPLPAAGTYTITLVARDLAGNKAEAQRTVTRIGALAGIAVEPAEAHVEVGESVHFRAFGRDQDGNPVDLSQFIWEASSGTIDQQGNFTATSAGAVTVTASVLTPAAMYVGGATVSVAGGPAALRVGSVPALTANGHDQWTLSVAVVDSHGTTVPSSHAPVTVRVADGAGLTVNGSIEATAQAEDGVATFTLQATTTVTEAGKLAISSGDLAGAELAYRTLAPAPARILLQAGSDSLHTGGSTTVTVLVEDHYGNPAKVAEPTRVVISGGANSEVTVPAGSSEASFTFHAGSDSGKVTLTATAERLGSASLTLQIQARPASGTIDGVHSSVFAYSGQILACVVDTTGAPVEGLTAPDFKFYGVEEQIPLTVTAAVYDSVNGTYTLLVSSEVVGGPYTLNLYVRGVRIAGEVLWPLN